MSTREATAAIGIVNNLKSPDILSLAEIIDGGVGNDTIDLGGGNDTIVLATGNGTDTVYNVPAGSPRFNLSAGLSFSNLTIAQSGNNTLIKAGIETLASLVGVQSSSITTSSFV